VAATQKEAADLNQSSSRAPHNASFLTENSLTSPTENGNTSARLGSLTLCDIYSELCNKRSVHVSGLGLGVEAMVDSAALASLFENRRPPCQ
jgi:hypothetical protein